MKSFRIALCALFLAAIMLLPSFAADKGTLLVVQSDEPESLDPHSSDDASTNDLCRKIFEGLCDLSPSL